MRSRSNKTCHTDMYILKYLHTPDTVDLLHKVLEKQTETKKVSETAESWKWGQSHMTPARWTIHVYLQSFHTSNTVDLLLKVTK